MIRICPFVDVVVVSAVSMISLFVFLSFVLFRASVQNSTDVLNSNSVSQVINIIIRLAQTTVLYDYYLVVISLIA